MNMRTFTEFWIGMFFLVATLTIAVFLYLVVDKTAKPVAEMAPLMLGEMDEMRKSMLEIQQSMEIIEELNPSVTALNHNMSRMTWVMDQRMGVMNSEMDRMGDKFSPTGMMPFNW